MRSTGEIGIAIYRNNEKIAIVKGYDLAVKFIKFITNTSYSPESMERGDEKMIKGDMFMFDYNTGETLFTDVTNLP